MMGIAGILIGAPLFFLSLYRCSRSKNWMAALWSLSGIVALVMTAAGIVLVVIPDFFQT